MSALLVSINLQGAIGGPVKHKKKQRHTIQTSDEPISKIILHSDRKEMPCYKVLNVSESTVLAWVSNTVPSWESEKSWNKKNHNQRIISYLDGLDEGFGYSFEYVS